MIFQHFLVAMIFLTILTKKKKKKAQPDVAFQAGNVTFSIKWTRGRRYVSKVSSWRCPWCILWRLSECCLLSFRQSHQMCHLGHSSPPPGPWKSSRCLHAVPFPQSFLLRSALPSFPWSLRDLPSLLCPPPPPPLHPNKPARLKLPYPGNPPVRVRKA